MNFVGAPFVGSAAGLWARANCSASKTSPFSLCASYAHYNHSQIKMNVSHNTRWQSVMKGLETHGEVPPMSPTRIAKRAAQKDVAVSSAAAQAQPVTADNPDIRRVVDQASPHDVWRLQGVKAQTGRVEVIVGPMFAGKTTALMQKARVEQLSNRTVLVLKNAKDDRYSCSNLATHDGDEMPCHVAYSLMKVPEQLGPLYHDSDVIAIDEAQFFPDLLDFVHMAADQHNKTLIIAGLDGDFKRQRFGQLLDVIPLADYVHKLHSKCYVEGCSHRAIFSLRTSLETTQELVGGADKYVAACRRHYVHYTQQQMVQNQ